MSRVDPHPADAAAPQATELRAQVERFTSKVRRLPRSRELTWSERQAIHALIESIAELLDESPPG